MISTILAFGLIILPSAFANPADSTLPPGPAPTNLWKVDNGVLRGARLEDQAQMDYLVKTLGVKTILNLQGGDDKSPRIGWIVDHLEPGETDADIEAERQLALNAGIAPGNYFSEPLNSLGKVTPTESERIRQIIAIMNDPARQPVYVHCAHGADRTGLVVALYRVTNNQLSPLAAYEEMLTHGHNFAHLIFTSYMDRAFFTGALKIVLKREFAPAAKDAGEDGQAADAAATSGSAL